ncbi:MAG: nitroreductase family protein [Bacteroidales bacterium]|jgi:ferredoxin|nr:nitroreductase family protein [Bacteroidales bacterium]
MAIPTSRTKEAAEILFHSDKCTGCGLCVKACGDNSLEIINKKAAKSDSAIFGCIGCGHCMAVCPTEAIEIRGRTLSVNDLYPLPSREKVSDYQGVLSLFQRRRSIRAFKDKDVEAHLIEKILTAAKTAPMGLPPSDVHVLIFDSKEKNRRFAADFCDYLDGMKWFVSSWFLALMRPFWGKPNDELFKGFVRPMFHVYTSQMKKGINLVNYDAPLSMYFYGSPYTDPADPIIAATYAMTAAESLGLGTCMLGSVHPLIQNGGKAKKFREKHGIKYPSREGLFVAFGYPDIEYSKGIRRTFASEVTSN